MAITFKQFLFIIIFSCNFSAYIYASNLAQLQPFCNIKNYSIQSWPSTNSSTQNGPYYTHEVTNLKVIEFDLNDNPKHHLLQAVPTESRDDDFTKDMAPFFKKHSISINPFDLLKRQINLYRRLGRNNTSQKKILKKKIGKISKINCITQTLLKYHYFLQRQFKNSDPYQESLENEVVIHERLNLDFESNPLKEKYYSEFGAMILTKNSSVKIFLVSNSKAYVPFPEAFRKTITDLVKNAYQFWVHLHNHPFNTTLKVDDKTDIGGTTTPSSGDLSTYRHFQIKLKLQNAWITNGYDNILMTASEFDQL